MSMINFISKAFLLAAVICCSQPIFAQDIIVASEEWPRATEKSGRGLYWDLLRAVYQQGDTKLVFKNMSYARSVKHVSSAKADLMLGASVDEIDGVLYPQYPLDVDEVYALHRPDTTWKNQHSLVGKKSRLDPRLRLRHAT